MEKPFSLGAPASLRENTSLAFLLLSLCAPAKRGIQSVLSFLGRSVGTLILAPISRLFILFSFLLPLLFAVSGCAPSTKHLPAVDNFQVERYMGRWYEIARFPHRFEKGLTNVTATYTLMDDSTVNVVNTGYLPEEQKWKDATGKAVFVDSPKRAHLKVTFFWPFSGAYKVLALDHAEYRYALVTSSTYDYLWILARSPRLDENTYDRLVGEAEKFGFDTSQLNRVDQRMHLSDKK
jgi:apolipoprotein D and lipocalin family protein